MRINKFLAAAGLGSRRKVEELVTSGVIKVNSSIVRDLATDITDNDVVEYLNKEVRITESKVYYALNKPKGVLTSCSDGHGRKLIVDYVPSTPKVFPVGRLDYETEGLIILTNDGDFANSVIHPSKHIAKTYEIITNKILSADDKKKLEKGVNLGDFTTLPARIGDDGKVAGGYLRTITIFEGRNRQIRKMFDSIGHNVVALKRISIGNLKLGDLKIGKYKLLTNKDLEKIFLGGLL